MELDIRNPSEVQRNQKHTSDAKKNAILPPRPVPENPKESKQNRSLLHILGMRTHSHNAPRPIIPPDLPNLHRRKRQRPSHLVRTALDLQHVAFPRGGNERGVDIRRHTRLLAAVGRNRQATGPVGQAGGHGSVQCTFGIEMAGFHNESRGNYALGCGDEVDVGEEEVVDGAVPLHVGPVVLDMEELGACGLRCAGHYCRFGIRLCSALL